MSAEQDRLFIELIGEKAAAVERVDELEDALRKIRAHPACAFYRPFIDTVLEGTGE